MEIPSLPDADHVFYSSCWQNQLGILWAGRDETEKSQGFLETAESIYQRYMKEVHLP